jgi:hypothetical protein
MRLRYTTGGKPIDSWVWLTTTVPRFGGHRWWFRCPALGIRAAKLYLPPRGDCFASRKAWNLTYRSCQDRRAGATPSFLLGGIHWQRRARTRRDEVIE